jgi:hypothetical protein
MIWPSTDEGKTWRNQTAWARPAGERDARRRRLAKLNEEKASRLAWLKLNLGEEAR